MARLVTEASHAASVERVVFRAADQTALCGRALSTGLSAEQFVRYLRELCEIRQCGGH